uniref:Senescence domain-containing protein n=1 Tax=Peronospora matthiolae TaxID=2874970 RepID=A0AAV1TPZ5_9STRA
MPRAGILSIKVHRLEAASEENHSIAKPHAVRFAAESSSCMSKFSKLDTAIEELLRLSIAEATPDAKLTMTIVQKTKKKKKMLVTTAQRLSEFLQTDLERRMTFTFGPTAAPRTMILYFCVNWEPQDTALVVVEAHRPWFMRALYYYDTSKRVYGYTTSFGLIAPFARFGEQTANSVLTTVSGKTLEDIDTAWVNPSLETLDDLVDAGVSTVLTRLYSGQQYALKTKDEALEAASNVAMKTSETVGKVKDFATDKVVSVSLSTYGMVKGFTVSVLSRVPVLGSRLAT